MFMIHLVCVKDQNIPNSSDVRPQVYNRFNHELLEVLTH